MKNRYIKRSRITEGKTLQMLDMFARDFTARVSAKYIDLGIKTAKVHFTNIRVRIAESVKERDDNQLKEIEIDPNFFYPIDLMKGFLPGVIKN